ncbi:MAG: hypothetical protein JXB26_17745 [Candidatus Aminicenantes bacterium]|nr:hypothetical protein [Candidatus Aminicenantes bacterium]
MRKIRFITSAVLLSAGLWIMPGRADVDFNRYNTPEELCNILKEFNRDYPGVTRLHTIAHSPGNRMVCVLEIGPECGLEEKKLPAVFVAANMGGTVPLAGEAAVYLARLVLDKEDMRKDKTWYILPCGNPDGASSFFSKPLFSNCRNGRPHNDDMDDAVDEDGVEDLNGDGIISTMRVRDPEGAWMSIPGEPRLMKRADWSKGEKGIYKLYTEGMDSDGDGSINEDGPGGVNIGVNFPHLFKFHTADAGAWAGSEAESFNLIKFIMEHKEIAAIFTFGQVNFCLIPPQSGRKAAVDLSRIKIPERIAGFINADPDKTYTFEEIMELVQRLVPEGMEVTESMVAGFLGLGAVVNPLEDDLKFYRELSEKYKEFLKEKKLDDRLETPRASDGSFELWVYYHCGLPSFALDFWTLPKVKEEKKESPEITAEKLEKMSDEDFIALGEEKIAAFLKSAGAPPDFKAKMVIDMVKSGRMNTKRMAEMLKKMPKPQSKEGGDPKEKALLAFSDKELEGKGFIPWKAFDHPDLGKIEIGGAVPFADNTPPVRMVAELLKSQVPWVFELVNKLPRVRLAKTEVTSLSAGIFRLEAWVENEGYLPYPTAMGIRNNRILPVIVSLEGEGFTIHEGRKRSQVSSLKGGEIKKTSWILQAEKPIKLTIAVDTSTAWRDSKTVELGGKK